MNITTACDAGIVVGVIIIGVIIYLNHVRPHQQQQINQLRDPQNVPQILNERTVRVREENLIESWQLVCSSSDARLPGQKFSLSSEEVEAAYCLAECTAEISPNSESRVTCS